MAAGTVTSQSNHHKSSGCQLAERHARTNRQVLSLIVVLALWAWSSAALADNPASPAGSSTPGLAEDAKGPEVKIGSNEEAAAGFWERDTLTGDWGGVRTKLINAGVTLGLLDQSEVWSNLVGGLRQGTVFNGLTTASIALDLEKLASWTGARFYVDAFQIHGRGPTANLVGNLQIVSNIEATDGFKLYDLWLEQTLLDGRLSVRIGQEGANDELMLTRYGALFLNSSFGFPGLPAADLPSGGPNYPLATPFVRVRYQVTDAITLTSAVFNGDPAPPGTGDPQRRDKYGTAFRLNDHILAFGELWYSINQEQDAAGPPGTYKLGVWYSSSHFADQLHDTTGLSLANPASNGVPRSHSGQFALYGIIDQMIWKEPGTKDQGIGGFLQIMGAPADRNVSNLFIEGGFNWKGPLARRDSDIFGLAFSYLGISPALRKFGNEVIFFTGSGSPYRSNETVVEATYLYQVAPWWTLQPSAQYVVNPGAGIPSAASRTPLKGAFVTGIRSSITF
jgi:porin